MFLMWSRSTRDGHSYGLWVTMADGSSVSFNDTFISHGVAKTVIFHWSRRFYDNTNDGCYVAWDGTTAGKYGGWVSYSYGVANTV